MQKKRRWSKLWAMALVFALMSQVILAQDFDLSAGDVIIDGTSESYHISQSGRWSANGITVLPNVKTTITLDGLEFHKKGITIQEGADVSLILKNLNKMTASNKPVIHVGNARLRILGTGQAQIYNYGSGASIGSLDGQAMTGQITLGEQSQVLLHVADKQTGIGAGKDGHMTGQVHVTDRALLLVNFVETTIFDDGDEEEASEPGTGIGSSGTGQMTGTITLDQQAKLLALQDRYVAADQRPERGLGTLLGAEGVGHMKGQIQVLDKAQIISGRAKKVDDVLSMIFEMQREGVVDTRAYQEAYFRKQMNEEALVIGAGKRFSSEDPEGSYLIAATASINGVSSAEAQAFIDGKLVNLYLSPEGKAVNYSNGLLAKASPPSFEVTGLKRVATPDHQITAGPVVGTVKAIRKKAASPELFDLAGKELLVLSSLAFEGQHRGNAFTLSFHLGPAHAGKRIEVQTIENGRRGSRIVKANGQGLLSFPVQALGSYALTIARPSGRMKERTDE